MLSKIVGTLIAITVIVFSNELQTKELQVDSNPTDRVNQQSNMEIGNTFDKAFIDVSILYKFVKKENIGVTGQEIADQVDVHKKLLPAEMINREYIRQSIAIRKYLTRIAGIFPDDHNLKHWHNEISGQLPESKQVSFSEIEPFLYCLALFNLEKTKEIVQGKRDESDREKFENRKKARNKAYFWSYKELHIAESPEMCIASDGETNSCLIIVAEYNAIAKMRSETMRKTKSLDSTRLTIIKSILYEIYLSREAEKTGFADKPNLEKEIDDLLERSQFAKKFREFGRPVTDEESLWEAYAKNYNEYFCKKEEVTIGLIGSSEQRYIDSLYTFLANTTKNDSTNKQKKESVKIIRNIPWKKSNWNALPDELVRSTDTLQLNEFSKPVKTGYGYFIAFLDSFHITDEIQFEDVSSKQLVYLATRDRWQNTDSIIEERAYSFYKQNRQKYVTPDTLLISGCLFPSGKDSAFKSDSQKSVISFKSTDLPDNARIEIEKTYKRNRKSKKMTGPVKTIYGDYYFKVLKVKPGGIRLSFKDVYNDIARQFEDSEAGFNEENGKDTKVSDDRDKHMRRGALAGMYLRDKLDTRKIDREEIWKLVQSGKINIPNVKDMQKSEAISQGIRNYTMDMRKDMHDKREQWLQTVSINHAVLE